MGGVHGVDGGGVEGMGVTAVIKVCIWKEVEPIGPVSAGSRAWETGCGRSPVGPLPEGAECPLCGGVRLVESDLEWLIAKMNEEFDVQPEERAYLLASGRCKACGHLEALHNTHCCVFCWMPECRCEWGEVVGG
jgi:hypothetical protein